VNTTHITATIRAILERENKPESWLATLVGISAPTINRLTQHRVSPESLKALCTKTPSAYGLEILIAHLRDEIDRSGRLQTEIKIDAAATSADDFTLLAIEAQTNPDLADVLHSMASMIRTAQAKLRATRAYPEHPEERFQAAAEDPTAAQPPSTASEVKSLADAAREALTPAPPPKPPAAPAPKPAAPETDTP
jgi:hypothetical protein